MSLNNERWSAPTDRPPVPSPQQEDRANALFHALAPAIGVDDARLLTDRLAHLSALLDDSSRREGVA